jgi:hypothetical protein
MGLLINYIVLSVFVNILNQWFFDVVTFLADGTEAMLSDEKSW